MQLNYFFPTKFNLFSKHELVVICNEICSEKFKAIEHSKQICIVQTIALTQFPSEFCYKLRGKVQKSDNKKPIKKPQKKLQSMGLLF